MEYFEAFSEISYPNAIAGGEGEKRTIVELCFLVPHPPVYQTHL